MREREEIETSFFFSKLCKFKLYKMNTPPHPPFARGAGNFEKSVLSDISPIGKTPDSKKIDELPGLITSLWIRIGELPWSTFLLTMPNTLESKFLLPIILTFLKDISHYVQIYSYQFLTPTISFSNCTPTTHSPILLLQLQKTWHEELKKQLG